MAPLDPQKVDVYHVFLASPGDCSQERQYVRRFFERFNRRTAPLWNVRFEVVGWENYAMAGVGRPQELITGQTLQRFGSSLALVIGIMGQRFGSPTGEAESGTEEEFNWALHSYEQNGFPQIKWFFRKVERFEAPPDPEAAQEALAQWIKVRKFRERLQNQARPVFYKEYAADFEDVFEDDLQRWLVDSERPWVRAQSLTAQTPSFSISPPAEYFESIERDFHRLDIAGIDNDRAFEIPLSDIYVRLQVILEDGQGADADSDEGPLDIQTALLRFHRLVIVGDPGSGKSTFLRYIALILSRALLSGNSALATEKLSLAEPLPLPLFVSCWDLSDHLRKSEDASLQTMLAFMASRLTAQRFSVTADQLETLLASGQCCVLFDGLDEVPTDAGRANISRLLEELAQRWGDNRFVITSRIRAYTGDAMLAGQFVRCEIQAFNRKDRLHFLRNWAALLFRVAPETVGSTEDEAKVEFESLTAAIEHNERIRTLAVNPLLLTVICIVHWNRKRLPEQRVELYDECVDVLLGQRKAAERRQRSRTAHAMDESDEDRDYEERAWIRKRFAEIALHILTHGANGESSKREIVDLLTPRFLAKGAKDKEQAGLQAERFLRRQELRSGLLVSRHDQSYRFVHLTFQEYLAAWQLSNLEFERVTHIAQKRLREAQWFECLQLLGSQWARESDEKVDRYIAWLLANAGTTISEQAPVVALCANIVRDVEGVAGLSEATRTQFDRAVKETLDAFRRGSKVPNQTQMEILEELGRLGPAVKQHLIAATSARYSPVRRRAVEILLPYLSTDELFALSHILHDQSREPIAAYLQVVIERDRERALALINSALNHPKVSESLSTLPESVLERNDALSRMLATQRAFCTSYSRFTGVRCHALRMLAERWRDAEVDTLLRETAIDDPDEVVRAEAVVQLLRKTSEPEVRKYITEQILAEERKLFVTGAIKTLTLFWHDEPTRDFLVQLLDDEPSVQAFVLELLAFHWKDDPRTQSLLLERATEDASGRYSILSVALEKWPDEATRAACEQFVRTAGGRALWGSRMLSKLHVHWPDERTAQLLRERAVQDTEESTRAYAARALLSRLQSDGRSSREVELSEELFRIGPKGTLGYRIDPWQPVSEDRIAKAGEALGLSPAEREEAVLELSRHMGWDIRTGAKPDAASPTPDR